MEKVRERIRGYILNGTIKTEGIKKLKREFNLDEKKIMSLWLDERDILQPPTRPSKKRPKEDYINITIKKKDVNKILEFIKSLK